MIAEFLVNGISTFKGSVDIIVDGLLATVAAITLQN